MNEMQKISERAVNPTVMALSIEGSKNPNASMKQKIEEIARSTDFLPLVAEEGKMEGKFALTDISQQLQQLELNDEKNTAPYLTKEEILELFKSDVFIESVKSKKPIQDKWSTLNYLRSFVSSALSQGLSKIILKNASQNDPIVEIGSGIGYTLPEELSLRTIRTQPDKEECQLLKASISDPVHEMDVQKMCAKFLETGKKVRTIFALNVIDTLPFKAREGIFSQISQIQGRGDSFLIMLDTNPYRTMTLENIQFLYPSHAIFPFYSLTDEATKFSVIPVPFKYIAKNLIRNIDFFINQEYISRTNRMPLSSIQNWLHVLQKKEKLSIIALEDFFAEQVQNELRKVGYKTNAYYHASFAIGDMPEPPIEEDLIYKPVTGNPTLRRWNFTDKPCLNNLSKKGISVPRMFTKEFAASLRQERKQILAAEILVIKAQKLE